MLQQEQTNPYDQWARTRFIGGGFAPVPPPWLLVGDVYRRPGLPDRIVAAVATEDPEADSTKGPWIVSFVPVDGAPGWHRARTHTVEAVRPVAGVDIAINTPRHVPSPYVVGVVQPRWLDGGMFAWVPGRVLRRGDEIDTEWFGSTYRTVAAVSGDSRTISLEPCAGFPDDDDQLHGDPDTVYWARRPAAATRAGSSFSPVLVGAHRILRKLGSRHRSKSHA